MTECKECKRIKVGKDYEDADEGALERAIVSALHIKDCKLYLISFNRDRNIALVKFDCDLGSGQQGTFEKEIKVRFAKSLCMKCYRQKSGYYEAIIQIRGQRERVESFMSKIYRYNSKRGGFVSKMEENGDGYDVYFGDKKIIGEFFEKNKRYKTKQSYELYGIKKGKKVYRTIYFLRLE